MRLGLGCVVVASACAAAEPPGEQTDAAALDAITRDAAVDARPPDAANLCPPVQTCATAMSLGMLSGDTGNGKLTAMGYRHAWFRVRVTEDDDEPVPGDKLRIGAKLTFPATVGFEVYVYVNEGNDVAAECSTTTGTRQTTGNIQTVRGEWGEGLVSNGSDDSRNVTVEVRAVGSNCAETTPWQLELEGNW